MYIVELVNPEKAELEFSPEVFDNSEDAEIYLEEMLEDRNDLEGIILSVLLEKNVNKRMVMTSARITYYT